MAATKNEINKKAKEFFDSLGLSPEAMISISQKGNGVKQSKPQNKVFTILEVCEAYAKAIGSND